MDNFDVKKAFPALYAPKRGAAAVVEVPSMFFLKVDGHGDPNVSEQYRQAVQALYSLSYAVRGAAKRELGRVHTVAPLEGLWWAADYAAFLEARKAEWDWTMMIAQPEWVTQELVDQATQDLHRKKSPVDLGQVRFESYDEGLSVQVLHVGSYDDEAPVIAALHNDFMPAHGLVPRGHHHEIYLSDPRRVVPEKMRTIVRQPVARQDS